MARVKDKVALVMGASRTGNMGQAIAARLAAEGAKVVVSGRGSDGLATFAEQCGATAISCDISSRDSVTRLVDEIVVKHGGLDIVVNAAAIGQYGPFEETTEEELDQLFAIIFKGSFFLMQAAVGAMTKSGGGSIINVTSAVATIMFENHASYMGVKAGVEQVTRSVAYEFGKHGIRANIIAPGFTKTPMLEGFTAPGMEDAFIKEMPLGRLNTVDDIANAALFIASDECFMTGQTFHVTGGLTLRRNPTAAEIASAVEAAAK